LKAPPPSRDHFGWGDENWRLRQPKLAVAAGKWAAPGGEIRLLLLVYEFDKQKEVVAQKR